MEQYARIDSSYYDNYTFGLTGDVKFYVEEAQRSPGRVLELACGTGRVTIPLALAGIDVVGIDLSEPMLDIAREKLAELGEDVRNRVQLVHGDMRSFFVDTPDGEKFSLAMIPYRSFCHILTPEDQSRVLARMCDHLADDGRLIINIFDPKLDWILEDSSFPESSLRKHHEFTNPATGNRVVIWDTRKYDLEAQVIDEDRIFEEIDRDGVVIQRSYAKWSLRWTYRHEMEYLLRLSGFKIEALYGDFDRGPFHYGGEQIWIARKA